MVSSSSVKSCTSSVKSTCSNTNNNANQVSPNDKQSNVTPIYVSAADWRKIAPALTDFAFYPPEGIQAKITTDGQVRLLPTSPVMYRKIQTFFRESEVECFSFFLPKAHILKVVIRGIPANISEEEIKSELENIDFNIKNVKRFGINTEPIPICLVIFSKSLKTTETYGISSLFYLSAKIESYQNNHLSQCFECQHFGHSSQNCRHSSRCVKCNGNHLAKDCVKLPEESPVCCNCGKDHTINYRRCEWYLYVMKTKVPVKIRPSDSNTIVLPITSTDKAATFPIYNYTLTTAPTGYSHLFKWIVVWSQSCIPAMIWLPYIYLPSRTSPPS